MRYTLKSRNSKLVSALSIKRYIKKVKNYSDFLTKPGTDKSSCFGKKAVDSRAKNTKTNKRKQ